MRFPIAHRFVVLFLLGGMRQCVYKDNCICLGKVLYAYQRVRAATHAIRYGPIKHFTRSDPKQDQRRQHRVPKTPRLQRVNFTLMLMLYLAFH